MPFPSTRVVHRDRACTVGEVLDCAKPGRATIKKRSSTKSAGGGDTVTWATVAADVPFRARISGRSASASDVGGRQSESAHWELTFPNGTTLGPLTYRVFGDGRAWDVVEVGAESYESEVRVVAVEVRP